MTAHANGWECRCGGVNPWAQRRCHACPMIRIGVGQLDAFRYWKDSEDAVLADLLADLSGVIQETPGMRAGKALAKFFEHADDQTYGEAHVDGWSFDFQVDAELPRPKLREAKAEMVIETTSGPVTLAAKADGVDGRRIHDQKLTERWDAERYLDSLQWRAYLVLFDADAFTYDVFVGRYGTGRNQGQVTITEYHPLTFYAYPDMRRDVERAVAELAAVIVRHLPARVAA